MRITIITIGSYGDVHPYIALGLRLQATGHTVCLATHASFKPFICNRGLDFFPIAGDPAVLLGSESGRAWLESGNNPLLFFRRIASAVQPYLQQGVVDCWNACQQAEAIVLAQLGICIAYPVVEHLGVPCCMAYLQPITPTRAFACPFFPAAPAWLPIGSAYYNRLTYFLSAQALWKLARPPVNRVRQELLHLPPLPSGWFVDRFRRQDMHFLYGYSPSVIPQPDEWGKKNHVTGYWFLDRPPDWQPPADLLHFLSSGPPPVYIGFGSMSNRNPQEVTEIVLQALARTRQRGVLFMGPDALSHVDLPDEVFKIDTIPHDWLFPHMAAVVHHGGAGTTATGLRAGIPSVLIPFFAEQPFWAQRVYELGVGPKPIPRQRLSAERLAAAISTAISDKGIRTRASALSERIRAEDGTEQAVEVLERYLHIGG